MKYKQAIYFIGNCLSLQQYPERKSVILNQINTGKVTWEKIVRVSSGHMVLPALYLHLKRAELLYALPEDLVAYLAELTKLNEKRNKALLAQAQDLISLLQQQDIQPIFLKGMAHLLEGLYLDLGERMIGDIDFLVAPHQQATVANLLLEIGYTPLSDVKNQDHLNSKHYPRLIHDNWIGAVEIHHSIMVPSYKNNLSYKAIFKNQLLTETAFVPSLAHQIEHNILNTQLNDKGFWYGKIMMRQLYDAYLLSFKTPVPTLDVQKNEHKQLSLLYLSLMQRIFKPTHFSLKSTLWTQLGMLWYLKTMEFPQLTIYINKGVHVMLRFFYLMNKIGQAFYYKEQRVRIFQLLKNPSKYAEHIQHFKYKG
jgi:hypothetical protein